MDNLLEEEVFDPSKALRQTRTHVYDQLNRLAKDIGAQGQTTTYGYDNNGNITGVTDPLGNTTSKAYDALNRLIRATDPNNGVTAYGYDANDHLTSVTDPRSLMTAYTYDGLNNLTSNESPDSGTTNNTYDAAGNVITSTDARGEKTTYTYDALNRRIKAAYADKTSTTWQYDHGTNGIGHLTTMTDPSGTTTWTYDQHGRVLQKQQKVGTITLTTAYTYDTAGRVATIIYPSKQKITNVYDPKSGLLVGIQVNGQAQALVSNAKYQPFGPVAAWTMGNAATYARSFDLDGRLTELTFGGSPGDVIGLTYDDAGRITGLTETALSSKTFEYDVLARLTNYTYGTTTQEYGYDPDGNRLSLATNAGTINYQYPAANNRMSGSTGAVKGNNTYDAAGNLIGDSSNSYTYNARGRLAQVTAITGATQYAINGLGQRVSKIGPAVSTGANIFIYDEAGNLIGEYDAKGNVIEETVWFNGMPAGVLKPGAQYYVDPDYLGAPHSITDQSGNLVWTWDRDPFGNGAPTGTMTYDLRLPGQYYDSETRLFYNMARDYNPAIGRYVQSDPIGLRGGINPYIYVSSNPINHSDPKGEQIFALIGPWAPYVIAAAVGVWFVYWSWQAVNSSLLDELPEAPGEAEPTTTCSLPERVVAEPWYYLGFCKIGILSVNSCSRT
jgi:RHS repeat-associated protein